MIGFNAGITSVSNRFRRGRSVKNSRGKMAMPRDGYDAEEYSVSLSSSPRAWN
jgi:hypothetical protein